MDRYNGWFSPGERVWYETSSHDGSVAMANVAPTERQTDAVGHITLLVGKELIIVEIGFVYHDVPEVKAYIAALREAKIVETSGKVFAKREGLIWGGKACLKTAAWAKHTVSEKRCSEAQTLLRFADMAAGVENRARTADKS